MADNTNNFDKLFKSTLSNHAVTPAPEIWDKLSTRLDNDKKPVVFIWWKWIAAAAIVTISFWLMYQPNDYLQKNTASLSVSDTKFIEKKPFSLSPKIIVSEKSLSEKQEENKGEGVNKIKAAKKQLVKNELKSNNSTLIKEKEHKVSRVKEQLPPALEGSGTLESNDLFVTDIKQPDFHLALAQAKTKKKSSNDYKVKIISNGYALQPEKEKLVEGLENKIGGFFTKVDEGFGGLQDAKNNLFASLTTKREKKTN